MKKIIIDLKKNSSFYKVRRQRNQIQNQNPIQQPPRRNRVRNQNQNAAR